MYITIWKIDSQWYDRGNPKLVLCEPRGVGWGGRWEGGLRGRDLSIPMADSC